MIQVRRRKLWWRSGLGLHLMEMPCLLARKLYRNFFPRPFWRGLGLSAAVPPAIPVSHGCLLGDRFNGHHWQQSLSCWREAVLFLSHATLLVMYSPMCRGLCIVRLSTLPISTIFHSPAALALCVGLYYPAKESLLSSLWLGDGFVWPDNTDHWVWIQGHSVFLKGLLLKTFSLDMS